MRAGLLLAPLLLICTPAAAQGWAGQGGGPAPRGAMGGGIAGGLVESGPHGTRDDVVRGSLRIESARAPAHRGVGGELRQLRATIRAARDAGQLSRSEARALRRQAWRIDSVQARYGRDGLSEFEQAALQSQVEVLRAQANRRRGGGQ